MKKLNFDRLVAYEVFGKLTKTKKYYFGDFRKVESLCMVPTLDHLDRLVVNELIACIWTGMRE